MSQLSPGFVEGIITRGGRQVSNPGLLDTMPWKVLVPLILSYSAIRGIQSNGDTTNCPQLFYVPRWLRYILFEFSQLSDLMNLEANDIDAKMTNYLSYTEVVKFIVQIIGVS